MGEDTFFNDSLLNYLKTYSAVGGGMVSGVTINPDSFYGEPHISSWGAADDVFPSKKLIAFRANLKADLLPVLIDGITFDAFLDKSSNKLKVLCFYQKQSAGMMFDLADIEDAPKIYVYDLLMELAHMTVNYK